MSDAAQSAVTKRWAPARLLCRLAHPFAGLLHHLPAAALVASLVAIGHLHFHLLDAIDGYAFIAIGNLSAVDAAAVGTTRATVAVVVIDQQSHESHYRERSPLNRCELLRDLGSLYQGRSPPKLMVIDLDLSPSPLVKEAGTGQLRNEAECEEQLYQLLERSQSTHTVLMEPFPVLDQAARAATVAWQRRMGDAGIVFGDATLPIRYGLVTRFECKADGLAAVAFRQFSPQDRRNCLAAHGSAREVLINPRQYLTGLRAVAVGDLPSRRNWPVTDGSIQLAPMPYEVPVVFFGGTYGDADTYQTPLGTMYGVEVHAAAYMSLVEPAGDLHHLAGLALDVLLALLFGWVISACWRSYYTRRFSSSALDRQISPYFVFGLGLAVLLLVILATLLSLYLLSISDLWLSPIPIAVGMTIESFFAGAVHEAVETGYRQRLALVARLEQAHRLGSADFEARVEEESRQHPHESHELGQSMARFVYLDIWQLLRRRQHAAAFLLLVRRLLWFLLLAAALALTVFH